jgi:hypothetical protein
MEIVEKRKPAFLCKILFSVECCCERHTLDQQPRWPSGYHTRLSHRRVLDSTFTYPQTIRRVILSFDRIVGEMLVGIVVHTLHKVIGYVERPIVVRTVLEIYDNQVNIVVVGAIVDVVVVVVVVVVGGLSVEDVTLLEVVVAEGHRGFDFEQVLPGGKKMGG